MSGLRHLAAPAITLMANLKYKTKISVVFGILLLPLALSLFFLVSLLGNSISVSQMQQQGLKGYHRILSNQIDGNTDKNPQVARALGYQINSTKTQDILEFISIESNLALDNQLASSYLNRSLVLPLPSLIVQINLLTRSANTVIDNNRFTPETFIALSNLNKSLPLYENQLYKTLKVATDADSTVSEALSAPLKQLHSAINTFKNAIEKKLLEPDNIALTKAEFAKLTNNVNTSINTLVEKSIPTLESIIEKKYA